MTRGGLTGRTMELRRPATEARHGRAGRVCFDRGCVEAPAVEAAPAGELAERWEWRALHESGADVVSVPGELSAVAADLAAHLPGLTAAPGFVCASLARVVPRAVPAVSEAEVASWLEYMRDRTAGERPSAVVPTAEEIALELARGGAFFVAGRPLCTLPGFH